MLKYYQQQGKNGDVAVYSTVTLTRNCKDLPFAARLEKEKAAQLFETVGKALADAGLSFEKKDFTALGATQRGALAEKGLAPQSLVQGSSPRGVYVSADESLCVIVGDEDHVKIQAQSAGLDLASCLEKAQAVDKALDAALGWAYSEKYGYLTASPVNLGCAMRAEVCLHLPMIAAASGARTLANQSARMGYELSGVFGEGSCMYLLSNAKSLGTTEKELVTGIESAAEKIMEREREMRAQLYKDSPEYLENRVYRALGLLGAARVITFREATALVSDARLGAGVLSDVQYEKLDRILRLIGPCAVSEKGGEEESEKTEVRRAQRIRRALA
ncbi:MAG: hypothetical protein IIZ49_06960 [Oscillospiraceae bacterium]|nr:hypothetical protein [Oscillospiraceae bacterium]